MEQLRSLLAELEHLQRHLTGLLPAAGATGNLKAYIPNLDAATDRLIALLGPSPDVIMRRFHQPSGRQGLICYLDNLVDLNQVDRDILYPLFHDGGAAIRSLPVGPVTRMTDWDQIVAAILQGKTAVFLENIPEVWMIDTAKIPQRSIGRPETEIAVRGPQEAFADVLAIQLSQLRHRLATPHLIFEQLTLGSHYPVAVAMAYLRDVVNPAVRQAVYDRLTRIQAETVVNATMVASYLRDRPGSFMPTVRNSERVDLVVWQLLQGKVAILVDGDPFALWVPTTLCDFYRTTDDYTAPWYNTTFIRGIRWLAWAFGLYLPAVYIALTEVNPDLVPPPLVILTAGSHTGLPFTPIVEVLVMILIIEILREAALRLPKALSTTIGTVGAIVVGTAVVKAGFVSPQIIVVMTLTGLSFFTAPSYEVTGTWRLLSWVMLAAAFVYGIYGLVLATIGLTIKLVSETSLGVPFLTPLAPFRAVDWADTLWRAPWIKFVRRRTDARTRDTRWGLAPSSPPNPVALRRGQIDSRP